MISIMDVRRVTICLHNASMTGVIYVGIAILVLTFIYHMYPPVQLGLMVHTSLEFIETTCNYNDAPMIVIVKH